LEGFFESEKNVSDHDKAYPNRVAGFKMQKKTYLKMSSLKKAKKGQKGQKRPKKAKKGQKRPKKAKFSTTFVKGTIFTDRIS